MSDAIAGLLAASIVAAPLVLIGSVMARGLYELALLGFSVFGLA